MSERSAFVILILFICLFSFKPSLASSYPSHSAAVQVTATVETPLGYKTSTASDQTAQTDQLIFQYPAIGGVQLTVEVDGLLIKNIILEQPEGLPSDPAFQRLSTDFLSQNMPVAGGSYIVTLISIAQ